MQLLPVVSDGRHELCLHPLRLVDIWDGDTHAHTHTHKQRERKETDLVCLITSEKWINDCEN